MSLTSKEKFELKKFLKELTSSKARHTELVTVYVPQGYDLNKIINHLLQEQGTATNIKSATTRKNVITSLEKMVQHLRLFKKTPENGLAIFSGNVSEREGQEDFKVWSIEPPVPINTRIYRCDKSFVTEILEKMLDVREAYGLVVMDKREGNVAILRGNSIIPLTSTKSNVPGKHKSGGQSAQRFERLREGAAIDFYKKIADMMKDEFLPIIKDLKGIIVGGPGRTKQDFVEGNYITGDLKSKILALKDLSYTGDFGLQELLDKSEDVLAHEEVATEKKLMRQFFELLAKEPSKVAYGDAEVRHAIGLGAVETLLLSEDLDDNVIEEFEGLSQEVGTDVQIITTDTREGVQLKEIGKIGAILRFALS